MSMPNRKFTSSNGYRYGFNGKENDKDAGEGIQDYGERIYETRLGRFLSTDPITADFPELTPYQFSHNNPIALIDLDGLEGVDPPKPGEPGKNEGEEQTTKGKSKLAPSDCNCPEAEEAKVIYKTWKWYSGNLNREAKADWYSVDEYKIITQDWEHGQVMEPGEGPSIGYTIVTKGGGYQPGGRSWNGYQVNDKGYLTGNTIKFDPELILVQTGGGLRNLLRGLGSLSRLVKTAPGLFKKGSYTVYSGFKDGILYIGKTGYKLSQRYSGKTPPAGLEALKGLSGTVPNNGIAKGIEQLVMNLNGWAGRAAATALSNKNAATVNDIYITVARRWLNQNIKNWETLFKF